MSNRVKAIANDIQCCIYDKPVQALITMAAGDPPGPMASLPTYYRWALLYGFKSESGTNNVGTVKVGWNSGANKQPIAVAPGGLVVIEAPLGAKWNLQDLYMDVANDDDGVVIVYS